MAHDLQLVLSHRPKRIILMTAPSVRLAGIAVTPEIGQNNRELFRKATGDLVPDHMCLRIAMKKEQGRAGTCPKGSYRGPGRRDIFC